MLRIAATISALTLLVGCNQRPEPPAAASKQDIKTASTALPFAETPASGDDDPNDVAIWIHPADPQQSLLLASAGTAGLESYELDGRLQARYSDAQIDHIKVAYGFPLPQGPAALLVGYDRRSGGLLTFTIDPASRQIIPVFDRPLATHGEIVGLCLYRSAVTATYYAFASGDDGIVQQWQLFTRDGKVHGQLVRTIPVGVGSAYCAVDDAAGELYVAEESVGVWKFSAEPESDASRTGVAFVKPLGEIEEEVKGLAIYKTGADSGYLIAADVAASRFNVYSLQDGAFQGSFALGKSSAIDEVHDIEGIAAVSVPLSSALPHGLFAVVDKDNEDGGNLKLAHWGDVAAALGLDLGAEKSDPRVPAPAAAKVVSASVETEPVPSYGDAADDPAIWVHPTDPARSLIIGTDKKRGLEVYNLAGKRVQSLPDGRMNNIDLRYGFKLGGREVAIAAATNRTDKSLALYAIDANGRLTNVTDGQIATGLDDPYGLCMYRSARSGEYFVFANNADDGAFRQWRLQSRGDKVGAEAVRDFVVGSQAEGCAADDVTGRLYIAEEDVGLWRYSAEPDGGKERTKIDDMNSGHLVDDVEGVAIFAGPGDSGYLIASSQGADNFAVYRRDGDNAFVGIFHVIADHRSGIDGISETDGVEVTSAALGSAFPHGVFVAQDGRNITPTERQNFKLVPWERIAEALSLPLK